MSNDRTILLVIPLIGFLLLFYFMVLGPKRQEASKLDEDVQTLQSQIDMQEQTATYAEQARQDFPKYYGRLVVLGKAVPEQADSASLLVQLNGVSNRSGVIFDSLEIGTGTGTGDPASSGAAATTTPAAPAGGTSPESTPASTDPTAQPTTPAAATETTAANLPIGATIGTAGLPTMPYNLGFTGTFFEVADFLAGVDGLVDTRGETSVIADGRLITVDGFVLKGGAEGTNPDLTATLAVTTYITPPEQGLTGGASPGGPALGAPSTTPTTVTVAP